MPFFVGKNTTEQREAMASSQQMESTQNTSITLENSDDIKSINATEYGLQVKFTDGTGLWLETEDLEKAGLINTANVVDWNTNGTEISLMTKNNYEWYAYRTENIYQK